jgi:hypothetical protein
VAKAIALRGPEKLVADEVVAITRSADLFVLNLECCIAERGTRWPDPRKPFFFRAPEGHGNSDHARDLPIHESVLVRTTDGRRGSRRPEAPPALQFLSLKYSSPESQASP